MHGFTSYFRALIWQRERFIFVHQALCLNELTWSRWQKWKPWECRSFSSAAAAASLLRFFNRNRAGKPIHQGFPSSNRDVKPGRKARGVAALVTHIKHAFLWTGCLERSGSWDSGEWRGTLLFKKTEGKKEKWNPAIEGYLSGKQTSG